MTIQKANLRLARVKQIPDLYSGAFTVSSIRWLIFKADQNGFDVCIRKIGRDILIDLDAFEKWVASR